MRAGVDPVTGEWLKGWPHCAACLDHLFRTRIGTVPWRRLFGASLKELQDQNASAIDILDFYTAAAEAVDRFEPAYRLRSIELVAGGRDGQFVFDMVGDFYPMGHLGDYTITENRSLEFLPIALTPGGIEAA